MKGHGPSQYWNHWVRPYRPYDFPGSLRPGASGNHLLRCGCCWYDHRCWLLCLPDESEANEEEADVIVVNGNKIQCIAATRVNIGIWINTFFWLYHSGTLHFVSLDSGTCLCRSLFLNFGIIFCPCQLLFFFGSVLSCLISTSSLWGLPYFGSVLFCLRSTGSLWTFVFFFIWLFWPCFLVPIFRSQETTADFAYCLFWRCFVPLERSIWQCLVLPIPLWDLLAHTHLGPFGPHNLGVFGPTTTC